MLFYSAFFRSTGYAFYSFGSSFGNPKLTAMQQAKKMNERIQGKISMF